MRLRINLGQQEQTAFRQAMESSLGLKLAHCLQCSKCGGMCNYSQYFDLTPRQLIESILNGLEAKVLHSQTIWLCGQCPKCMVECPAGIPLNLLMKTARKLAEEHRITPNLEPIDRTYRPSTFCPKQNDREQRVLREVNFNEGAC